MRIIIEIRGENGSSVIGYFSEEMIEGSPFTAGDKEFGAVGNGMEDEVELLLRMGCSIGFIYRSHTKGLLLSAVQGFYLISCRPAVVNHRQKLTHVKLNN